MNNAVYISTNYENVSLLRPRSRYPAVDKLE